MNDHRHPKGTPAGGQFAASAKGPADIGSLTPLHAFDAQARRVAAEQFADSAIEHLAVTAPERRHLDNGYHEGLAHADLEAYVVLTRGAPHDDIATTETTWWAATMIEEADQVHASGGTPSIAVPHGLEPMSHAEARLAAEHFARHAMLLADTAAAQGPTINGKPSRQDGHLEGVCRHAAAFSDPHLDDDARERRAQQYMDAVRRRAAVRQTWTARERRKPTAGEIIELLATPRHD